MKEANKIDINSLHEEAKKSEEKEAFTVLVRTHRYRVGVGAKLTTPANSIFFVEIIASLCPKNHAVNLHSLKKNLQTLKQLKERGYMLTCEEDGTISCELVVPSKDLAAESKAAILMVKKRAGL
jgi:hypothetical protein